MPPRGTKLACTLKSTDGAIASFHAYAGEQPGTSSRVEPIVWNRATDKPVQEGAFIVIGDMGMTGQVFVMNQKQWSAITDAKLEMSFYGAILWGKSPFKVIEEAERMLKRAK